MGKNSPVLSVKLRTGSVGSRPFTGREAPAAAPTQNGGLQVKFEV
jgi:hypothetical protein